jgi:hypothetical protein
MSEESAEHAHLLQMGEGTRLTLGAKQQTLLLGLDPTRDPLSNISRLGRLPLRLSGQSRLVLPSFFPGLCGPRSFDGTQLLSLFPKERT